MIKENINGATYWSNPEISGYFTEKEPNRYLMGLLENFDNGCQTVLDIGCGYGRNLKPFAKRNWLLYGYDTNPEAVVYTKKLFPKAVNIDVGDIKKKPFATNKFNFIIADGVLHQLGSRGTIKKALKYMKAIAMENSPILISIFTNDREPENCTSLVGNIYKNREGLPMLLLPSLEIIALIEDVGLSWKFCCSDIFDLTRVGKRANLTVVASR
jgi:SAM-dependent methyltransferase